MAVSFMIHIQEDVLSVDAKQRTNLRWPLKNARQVNGKSLAFQRKRSKLVQNEEIIMSRTDIFVNRTSNGDDKFGFGGGLGLILVWGTFDTATVKLFITPDGTLKIPVLDNADAAIEFTADGLVQLFVAPGFEYILETSSVGGSTSINASIGQSPPL